jgi:hypothetical protein
LAEFAMHESQSKAPKNGPAGGAGESSFASCGDLASAAHAQMMPAYALGQDAPGVSLFGSGIQTKLTVGQPDDPYEKEADAVADGVATSSPVPNISRLTANGNDSAQRLCEECEDEQGQDEAVQSKEATAESTGEGLSTAPAADAIQSNRLGAPLSPTVRAPLESRLGVDLNHVRVHNDGLAHEAASGLKARAFTSGRDIWLGRGESSDNTRLMAHEATHVVQQTAEPGLQRRIQRKPEDHIHPEDGALVRERVLAHIDEATREQPEGAAPPAGESGSPTQGNDGPDVGTSQENAQQQAPETRRAVETVDRRELDEKKNEVAPEAQPDVDRVAEQGPQIEQAATESGSEAEAPPQPVVEAQQEAPPEQPKQGASAVDAAQQAATLANQAFAVAEAVPQPDQPPEVVPPEPVAPVDAAGEPLPANPQADAQVSNLAQQAQSLRSQGQALREHAAQERGNAEIMRGNIQLAQSKVQQADAGIQASQQQQDYRHEVIGQAQSALQMSEEKTATVASEAPGIADKASEGKEESGPMAGEAREKAAESRANTPDDPEAGGKMQETGGKLNQVGSDTMTTDDAITQTQTRAGGLVEEAAQATAMNTETRGKLGTLDQNLAQTDARLTDLSAKKEEAGGQLDGMADGPVQLVSQADELDVQGQQLIQASTDMEARLHQVQENYAEGMSSIPAPIIPEPNGAGGGGVIQRTPEEGRYEDRVNLNLAGRVSGALPQWVTGSETPASQQDRAAAHAREEARRAAEIQEIQDAAGGHFETLSAGTKVGIALELAGRNLFRGVAGTNWPHFAGGLVRGLVDPRVGLMGVVSGLSMTLSGVANLRDVEFSWQGLGNLLKSAADIVTGITIILGSITMLATAIVVIMAALMLVTLGFAAPIALPVIGFCTPIIATVGAWTISFAEVALVLQGLVLIKNLIDAAVATSARDLQNQSDQMVEDAQNMGNMAMQIGMAKVMQVGGRAIGGTALGQRLGGALQGIGERVGLVEPGAPAGGGAISEPVSTGTAEPVTTGTAEPVTTGTAEPVTTEPVTTEPVTTEPVTTEPVTDPTTPVEEPTARSEATDPNTRWPPQPPEGPKPELGEPNAAEWRYQRYRYRQSQAGVPAEEIPSFDEWKPRNYDTAAGGGRPGRRGGAEQVGAKEQLTAEEGIRETENVKLGENYPDGVRPEPNANGGTDYFEVGKMNKNGLPEARERAKLANEVAALGEHDTVSFVDKTNISRRITYRRGDNVNTKRLGD